MFAANAQAFRFSPTPQNADSHDADDPLALLRLARQINGVGPETKSWHIRGTYSVFDTDGKPVYSGIFEMLYADPEKYKRIFASDVYNQTEYGTDHGPMRTGDTDPVPYPERLIFEELIQPLPTAQEIDQSWVHPRSLTLGADDRRCVGLSIVNIEPLYCFDAKGSVLRFSSPNSQLQIAFDRAVMFRDRYVPTKVSITNGPLHVIDITVDQVNEIGVVPNSFFVPPADAQVSSHNRRIVVAAGVMQRKIIKSVSPSYPEELKRRHVEGTVVLSAVITAEGRVSHVRVLKTSDPELARSALAAVGEWKYDPYVLNSVPIEIATQINVTFKAEP